PAFVIGSSTATKFIVTSGGNVGVGTTTPWAQLSINPSGISGPAFAIGSSTATKFVVSNIGNVGIGSSTPNTRLVVDASSLSACTTLPADCNVMRVAAPANSGFDYFLVGQNGLELAMGYSTTYPANTIQSASGVNLAISASKDGNDHNDLFISTTHKVGISTSSPWGLLSVNPSGITGPSFVVGSSTATNFVVTNGGSVGIGTTSPAGIFAVNLPAVTNEVVVGLASNQWAKLKNNGSSGSLRIESSLAQVLQVDAASSTSSGVLFTNQYAQTAGFISTDGTNPSFFGALGGNVGVGTTTPNLKFVVNAGATASNGIQIDGTNNPIIQFSNAGTSKAVIAMMTGASGALQPGDLYITTTDGTNGNIVFATQAGTVSPLYLARNGNVGIGTTSPWAQLSVNPSGITGPAFAIGSSTATKFVVTNGGLVGIGTASPSALLDVTGGRIRVLDNGSNNVPSVGKGLEFGATGSQSYVISYNRDTSAYQPLNLAGAQILLNSTNAENVGIGTTSAATLFEVGKSGGFPNVTFDEYKGCTNFTSDGNGRLQCVASDQRLKQDITTLSAADGLAAIRSLNPVSFYWRPETERGTALQFGFIAQQMQSVFPNLVGTSSPTALTPDGTMSVNYDGLIAPAILGIQALDSRTSFISSATTSTVLSVDGNGNVGIGTSTPNHTLSVNGDVGAIAFVNTSTRALKTDISYVDASSTEDMLTELKNLKLATYRYTVEPSSDPLRLGLIAEDTQQIAPEILSPDGKGIDLYKLATFTLGGVQTLAAKVDAQETRIASLEQRVALLESGAISSASASPISISTTSLASALNSFGVLIEKGIAQFNTLVFREIVASKDANGTSSAGSGTVLAGNTVVQIQNSLVRPSTKVFVTFNSPLQGTWYVSDKAQGSFRVTLSQTQTADVSFDYFLLQTEGQIATSTPSTNAAPQTAGAVAPMTVIGDNPLHLSVGGTFVDPGVSVSSGAPVVTFVNGTQQAANSTTISTANPTTYIITYQSTDASGQIVSATRSVIVGNPDGTVATSTPPGDTTPPVVTLLGNAAMQLTEGDAFTDPGATALDNVDGDLTAKITETGSVDTATVGAYTLTYSATDAAGNTGSVSRVVSVVAPAATGTTTPAM
ncbi:MAG TPA: immunoglobulin-like domain-containing protein, partial [Candidatus Paceibacterota bacterium]|nr:immunoglobulin-like domain-containing protein [Candidatus Paceibacterota bacterium]